MIAKKTLINFWIKHPDAEQSFKAWYREARKGNWKTPNHLKKEFPFASILENNKVVFNIKGNKYRLIVRINYDFGIVWIRFVGTHAEYDKIDAATV